MKKFTQVLVSIVAVGVLAACGNEHSNNDAAAQQQYVPQVEVASVAVESIANYHEFSGTTQAPESIELRPRISGYIQEVHFQEGSYVNAGDLLFSIDNGPFLAESNRLKAELEIAKSQYKLAQKEFERANTLIKTNAISKELLDARDANVQQSKARIASVESALDAANLQLEYTQITAPISGVVSNAYITKGNYVNAGSSVLTNLVSSNELHTYFDANQATLLAYKKANASAQSMPVLLSVDSAQQFEISGVIDFVDNRVNTQTGTIRARALVNNDSGFLVPGLFTRLRVYSEANEEVVLVKDEAVGTDLSNKYVLVVNEDNVVQYKAVTLGEKVADLRIITSGLLPSDTIVVNGLQRVRPGTTVDPITVDMASPESLAKIARTQSLIAEARSSIEAAKLALVNSAESSANNSDSWAQARLSY